MIHDVVELKNKIIKSIRLKRYATIGFEKIVLELSDESLVSFNSIEKSTPFIECFELSYRGCKRDKALDNGFEKINLDSKIDSIVEFVREEWLTPIEDGTGYIGNNPKQQEYGPSGSAPVGIEHKMNVKSGILFNAQNGTQQLLVSVSDFPLLLNFTMDKVDINEFIKLNSVINDL